MKLSIGSIQDFLLRQKAKRHEKIKHDIERLKIERNLLTISSQAKYKITIVDKRIKQLERKLLKGRI